MTYSISLSGHGATADDAKEVFENTVRALKTINGPNQTVSGQISGSDDEGNSFSMQASEVQELDAEDTSDEDTEEDTGAEPE